MDQDPNSIGQDTTPLRSSGKLRANRSIGLATRLQSAVRRSMLDHSMRPADGRLLLALSGGPDSTVLLLLLERLAAGLDLELHAAYFDHGLRGRKAGRREADFVRRLCDSLGVALTTGCDDVRSFARSAHLSLEDAARRRRYAFLARAAHEAGCSAVATGHTASDQAETVLLHLIRGAGLAGLAGMPPNSAWPFPGEDGLQLLRPMLSISSSETRDFCASFGIEPILDESNLLPEFRRNRVRNEVLPLLRELNPNIEGALVGFSDIAFETLSFIDASAQALVAAGDSPKESALDRGLLASAPASLRLQALRLAFARASGSPQDLGRRHLLALQRLVLKGKTGDRLDLPRSVRGELRRDFLHLQRDARHPDVLPEQAVELPVPGEARYGRLRVAAGSNPTAGAVVEVDAEALGASLKVRRRRDGDRFQPAGMRGTKKLQDFFVDQPIPRTGRDAVPIFENERGIVWVGGLRVAEWAKPRRGRPTLFLSFETVSD